MNTEPSPSDRDETIEASPPVTAEPPAQKNKAQAAATRVAKAAAISTETAEQRGDFAYVPAFVAMLVMTAAERYLAACLLAQAANKGSWLAVEAFVFVFDRQPTFIAILLGFDIQEVHPLLSPLTLLRALLQIVHFGSHFFLFFLAFRWCYRKSRTVGHAACVAAAAAMLAVWFVLLPALCAHLPGPRKAEKDTPRRVSRPFD